MVFSQVMVKSSVIVFLLFQLFFWGAAAQSAVEAGDEVTVVGGKAGKVAVPTYHYDNLRTGWNNRETTLSAASFPGTFGILQTVTLDDQVDAQPLLVPGLTIAGGNHDVVYVATESNTVYAIDATTGAILLSNNLGGGVSSPLGCNNNGPNVGITSTPVIDLTNHTLYVISYVSGVNGAPPTYQLHALDLSTLTDKKGSPVTVAASHKLVDGSTIAFNATYQRQRAGLLLLGKTIYAGFTSFCDLAPGQSRGWLLGWNLTTLAPLPANQLDDTQTSSGFFLSSIWMSGFGIAALNSDLYFATGNSNPGSYDGKTDIQESVVELSKTLTSIVGLYTPANEEYLDSLDMELGSGGVMVFPTGNREYPYLTVAGGKDGNLFLLNPHALNKPPLDTLALDECWCGPSYFTGSDGKNRIVVSGGWTVRTFQVQLTPKPHLVLEGAAPITPSELQDPGFFTVVSSNGTKAGSAIIWAVGRPSDPDTTYVTLYAFDPTPNADGTLNLLYSAPAGTWPNIGGNPNIVPVVANGKVYVASAFLDGSGNTRGQLTIFGAGAASAEAAAAPKIVIHPSPAAPLHSPHAVTGTLLEGSGSMLTLTTRTGKNVSIDASEAIKNGRVAAALNVGAVLTVQGSSLTGTGALLATSIVRAKGSGRFAPPDH